MVPRLMALFTEHVLCPIAICINYSILPLDEYFEVGIIFPL